MEITASLLNDLCFLIYINNKEIHHKWLSNQQQDSAFSIEGDVIVFHTDEDKYYLPADEIITLDTKGSGHINVYMDYHEEMIESMQRQLLPIKAYVITPLTENHVVKYLLGLKN